MIENLSSSILSISALIWIFPASLLSSYPLISEFLNRNPTPPLFDEFVLEISLGTSDFLSGFSSFSSHGSFSKSFKLNFLRIGFSPLKSG